VNAPVRTSTWPVARRLAPVTALLLTVGLFVPILAASPARAEWWEGWEVYNTNDAGPGSLRQAVLDDAFVEIHPSLDLETIHVGEPILITGDTTIFGRGTTLDGGDEDRIFEVDGDADVEIIGLTLTHGAAVGTGVAAGLVNLQEGGGGAILMGEEYEVNSGKLTLSNVDIVSNRSTAISESVQLSNGEFFVFDWPGAGGGVYAHGALEVFDSTIRNNSADGLGFEDNFGGGIVARGDLTVTGSTISGNVVTETRDGLGGGIVAGSPDTSVTITNSTISGNEVAEHPEIGGHGSFRGGGLVLGHGVISNSTIAGNLVASPSTVTGRGSNVYAAGPAVQFASTLVAPADGAVESCFSPGGPPTSRGFNLEAGIDSWEDPGSCGFNQASDEVTFDPGLGPLADNGGPTQTHALLPGSPAVDAGSNPLELWHDQRGPYPTGDYEHTRASGGGTDVGAYEACVPFVTAVSPSSGPPEGGTSVTITGTCFFGATAVKFGITDASSFTADSHTQITATSPAHEADVVDVRVAGPEGTSRWGTWEEEVPTYEYAGVFDPGPTATISGIARVGETLTAGEGNPSPEPEFYYYDWYADGTVIEGAYDQTFTLTSAQAGQSITVRVTAILDGYADASDVSDPTAPVATLTAKELDLHTTATTSAGSNITVEVRKLDPSETYTIKIDDIVVKTGIADDKGKVKTRVTVPSSLQPGNHTITVTGASPDRFDTDEIRLK
jgi:hypothetical protein